MLGVEILRGATMAKDYKCRAIKHDGKRCENPEKFAGFCGVHFPKAPQRMERESTLGQKVKLAADTVALAGGTVVLIEAVTKLWQSLPFGLGPRMPEDYDYLSSQIGPSHPEFAGSYTPFSKGPETVDWSKARGIYDTCQTTLGRIESGDLTPFAADKEMAKLDENARSLLDTLQPTFAEMLYRKVGREADVL